MPLSEPAAGATGVPRTVEEVRDWLVRRVAHYVEKGREQISPSARLTDLGLDSVYAFVLCGDIEDQLGAAIDPTAVWDHSTIDALADHVAGLLAQPAATDR